MRQDPRTDKVRFIDLDPGLDPTAKPFIHTIELSDHRSDRDFLTLFTVGKSHEIKRWIADLERDYGVDLHYHDSETFHKDAPPHVWLDEAFPNQEQSWNVHYHWLMETPPTFTTVEPILTILGDAMNDRLRSEILEFYKLELAA